MMDYIGQIQRADFKLRARYPDLTTEIIQCSADRFIIHCQLTEAHDFAALQQEFDDSIRLLTLTSVVDVSPQRPAASLRTIPAIADADTAKGFLGVTFSPVSLLNLLLAKFPHVPFHEVSNEAGKVIVSTTTYQEKLGDTTYTRFLNATDRPRVEDFLRGLALGLPFELVEVPDPGPDASPLTRLGLNPVQYLHAANARRGLTTRYGLRDEALWFDNVDQIFAGTFRKDQLFFYQPEEYACYVDYSHGNIDVRNLLLLFQAIYLTPPYSTNLTEWLHKSGIDKNEFLELVVRNRIRLVLTQPESRYDLGFVQEVFAANEQAVITRRALATLLQADLVELADNYLLNDPKLWPEMHTLCSLAGQHLHVDARYLYESLMWPLRARRQSFEGLNESGIMATSYFGVNNLLQAHIKQVTGRDLALEFMLSAANVHVANALNATYFPCFTPDSAFDDYPFAALMGSSLNLYKNSTAAHFKSLTASRQEVASGVLPINPIVLFEIEQYLPIDELEQVLSKEAIFPGSKHLMATLAALSPEARQAKIDFYNQEVNAKLGKKKKGLSAGQLDLGTNTLIDGIGLASNLPFLGTAYTLLKRGTGLAGQLPAVKNTLHALEEALHGRSSDRDNISYLSKINRVARLRRF